MQPQRLQAPKVAWGRCVTHTVGSGARPLPASRRWRHGAVSQWRGGGCCAPVVGIDLEEELDGVTVELEGDGLQEGDEVREHLLVAQVEPEADDVVEVVVAEQEEHRRLLRDVGDQDRESLHTHAPATVSGCLPAVLALWDGQGRASRCRHAHVSSEPQRRRARSGDALLPEAAPVLAKSLPVAMAVGAACMQPAVMQCGAKLNRQGRAGMDRQPPDGVAGPKHKLTTSASVHGCSVFLQLFRSGQVMLGMDSAVIDGARCCVRWCQGREPWMTQWCGGWVRWIAGGGDDYVLLPGCIDAETGLHEDGQVAGGCVHGQQQHWSACIWSNTAASQLLVSCFQETGNWKVTGR